MSSEHDCERFGYVKTWRKEFDRSGWWHSFELPNNEIIHGVSTVAAQKKRIAQFPIPQDLSGKRVLDVGTWDGWFAIEMERRGAEVTAIDRWKNPRFFEIRDIFKSRIKYYQLSVYDLDPAKIGCFDIVLFMGVLYHLKHPLLALERVCSVSKDFVAVESFVLRDVQRADFEPPKPQVSLEFYETDQFGGEFDNWVAPTPDCLLAFCRTAGFVRVSLNNIHDFGAAVSCYRKWTTPTIPHGNAELVLLGACHTATGGINFQAQSSDDYVACLFLSKGVDLDKQALLPEVSGYAASPVFIGRAEGCWQVNFKLPPGLNPGWHRVQLRTEQTLSNFVDIAIDVPAIAQTVRIHSVCDGIDWSPSQVSLGNGYVSIWVEGLAGNSDVNNVSVLLAGQVQITTFVGKPGLDGVTQVNARLRPTTPLGSLTIDVEFGGAVGSFKYLKVVN